jgi:hypothetical protein
MKKFSKSFHTSFDARSAMPEVWAAVFRRPKPRPEPNKKSKERN